MLLAIALGHRLLIVSQLNTGASGQDRRNSPFPAFDYDVESFISFVTSISKPLTPLEFPALRQDDRRWASPHYIWEIFHSFIFL